jgi:hypothetical protein
MYYIRRSITMICLICVVGLTAAQAGAAVWNNDDIENVKKNAKAAADDAARAATRAKNIIDNEIGKVAIETKDRFDQFDLDFRDSLLRNTVDDSILFLESQRDDYIDFVGSGEKCGAGSSCSDFREQLRTLIQDTMGLSTRFEFVDSTVFSHSSLDRIDNLPPFMLFGIYEAIKGETIQRLLELPAHLADIYDEVDDPELFSPNFALSAETAGEESTTSSLGTNCRNDPDPQTCREEQRAERRSSRRDATTRFCSRLLGRTKGLIDPIRLNRIRFFISYLQAATAFTDGVNPEDIKATGVVAAGGGSALPWTGKFFTVGIDQLVNLVGAAVDTRIANLDVCRSL